MDTTIRNLDEVAYRKLKARAALAGKTIGEMMSEAIRVFLRSDEARKSNASLLDIEPESWGPGSERSSEEIDAVVYGDDG